MTHSPVCEKLLEQVSTAVGEFNIYNFYDNCGPGNQVSVGTYKDEASAVGTFSELRERFSKPSSGGQAYPCGTGAAAAAWCNNDEARAGFHMHPRSFYPAPWAGQAGAAMNYSHYTGASFDLYPDIVTVIHHSNEGICQ